MEKCWVFVSEYLGCGPCRSSPVIDMVPTFTTSNERICLLMTSGQMGSLRIEDAERLQVPLCFPAVQC